MAPIDFCLPNLWITLNANDKNRKKKRLKKKSHKIPTCLPHATSSRGVGKEPFSEVAVEPYIHCDNQFLCSKTSFLTQKIK